MESVVANWPTVLTCLSAAIALLLRVRTGVSYSLPLLVIISCVAAIGVDYAFYDVSDGVRWHAIAVCKVGAVAAIATYIAIKCGVSVWWKLVLASFAIDFTGNALRLYSFACLDGEEFAVMYDNICIVTALLEGIAVHGGSRLANHRDMRSSEFSSADRLYSAYNYYDQV